MTLLELFAEAIKKHEGWFVGSMSQRNNNPGNLRSWSTQIGTNGGFAVFKTYDDGWNALLDLIRRAATGQSSVYSQEMSIISFFRKYAPSADNNNPDAYAKFVAGYIGKDVNFKIRYLLETKFELLCPVDDAVLAPWPVGDIVQVFGVNVYFYQMYDKLAGHDAIDVKGKKRTKIVAAHSGSILAIGDGKRGKFIYLIGDKINNVYPVTYYGHLDEIIVSEGQALKAGEQIGYLGHTGIVFEKGSVFEAQLKAVWGDAPLDDGDHTHFGLFFYTDPIAGQFTVTYRNGKSYGIRDYNNGFRGAVDPMKYFINQPKKNDMLKILGDVKNKKDQYVLGKDGKIRLIYNQDALNDLHNMGVIDKIAPVDWQDISGYQRGGDIISINPE